MIRRLLGSALVILLFLFLTSGVQAASSVVYGTASDGYLYVTDATYNTAHGTANGTVDDVSPHIRVGQITGFTIYRSALFFDTWEIPDNAEISSAKLYLYGKTDGSTTDFAITIVPGSELSDPLVGGDFGVLRSATTDLGNVDTSGFSTSSYNAIDLNAVGLTYINKEGWTQLGLRSDEDIGTSEPADSEYVEIWSQERGLGYGPKLEVTYSIPTLGSPDTKEVNNIKVYSGYLESDDQLFVFTEKVVYPVTPDVMPGDYYWMQLVVGEVVKAQVPLVDWGYNPQSIYLSADSAVSWGVANCKIRLQGNPSKFDVPPIEEKDLVGADWRGSDLNGLDNWVKINALLIGLFYDDSELYRTDVTGKLTLNEAGGILFGEGIPHLSVVRPDLFLYPEIPSGYQPEEEGATSPGSLGTSLTAILGRIGAVFNLSGSMVGGIIWFAVVIGIVSISLAKPHTWSIGVVVALPALLAGIWFDLIALWSIALTAAVLVVVFFYTMWLRRT